VADVQKTATILSITFRLADVFDLFERDWRVDKWTVSLDLSDDGVYRMIIILGWLQDRQLLAGLAQSKANDQRAVGSGRTMTKCAETIVRPGRRIDIGAPA